MPEGEGPVIRVAIADDQALVRQGLAMLVGSQRDLDVVAQASDGGELLAVLTRVQADVVLMDVRMPGMDGLAATQRLLERPDPPHVVMLTTFDLDEYVVDAVRAGASGFLLKDAHPDALLDAIRTVHRGDAVISPLMTRRLLEHARPLLQDRPHDDAPAAPDPRLSALTEREREVFALVAEAASNAEIAAALHLSEATVKTHVAHLLQKLGARDRVQAVVVAYETGFVAR